MKGLSVVIATLGGDCLHGTVEKLNSGTVVPDEILICIPKMYIKNLSPLDHKNIEVIETECTGQVGQRAIGFQLAKYDLVLQLDDDLIVKVDCLEKLIKSLNILPENSAVAPQYFIKGTMLPFHQEPSNGFLLRLYYLIINGMRGYEQGVITKAGTPVGCTFNERDDITKNTQWLPGGCVLHYKANLVKHNFFPLTGKAFSEDLFHSELLKKKGIMLFVVRDAHLWLDKTENLGIRRNFKNILADYRSRKIFIKTFEQDRSLIRLHSYYFLNFMRHLIR